MNHRRDFGKSEKLAQTLRQAWQKMTKIHTESSNTEQAIQEAEEATEAMVVIKTWSETEEERKKYKQHLNKLLSVKQGLVKRSMNLQAWSDLYLSQPAVQQYLIFVMEAKQDSSSENTEHIKLLMRQLVKPSDVRLVEELKDVSEWLYYTDRAEAVVALECTDIATLKTIVEGNLDEIRVAKAKSGSLYEESPEIKIQATVTVTKAVSYVRNSFKEANQKYEELFLVTLLFPCEYDVKDRIFRRYLTTSDLEYLKKELDVRNKEFGGDSPMKLQAHLFNLTVKMYNREDVDVTEAQVNRHLEYLQNELKDDIDPQVEGVLQNHSDWEELMFQLDSLEKGILLGEKQEGSELLTLLTETETTKPTPRSESTKAPVAKIPSGHAQELLKKLGLLENYQQKLTLKDAVLVRQETLGEKQCAKLELLPYFIMQKLMMHDYQCRGVLFQDQTTSTSHSLAEPSQERDEFDEFDDFDEKPPSESSSSEGASSKVHPMDGLLALLHSSDNFLRQELWTKLSTCQLAIPFLLPDPITHTLSLSLWAMRRIIKEWKCTNPKTGKSESGGSPIVSYSTPIVSFCRLTSNRSELSKSRILNEVISDSPHNYFFHFHCDGGSTKSLLTDGLVELCWYLPAGKPKDPFAQVITFTNLRGDATSHPKQTKFLSQVSFMTFVLLTEDNLDEKGVQILKDLADDAPGGIVLMFLDKKFTPKHEGMKLLTDSIPKEKFFRMKLSGKSAADIKASVRDQINKKLSSQDEFRTIEDCARIARANGINVDEDDPDCVQGRALANEIQDALAKLPTSDKNALLPLQGQTLWHKWAMHDKELHRHVHKGNKGIEQYNSQKENDKFFIRRQQLSKAKSPSPVMKIFLSNLLTHKGIVRNYFLQWLKFILDDHSRQRLPKLFRQYQNVRMELLQLQRDRKSDNEEAKQPLIDQLKVLNDKLVHASFGLEHLLREIGQVYEATVEQKNVPPQLREQVNCLPQVAAELLASGYPLELMDGDASHVPLCWVMAVLDKLCTQLKDARLFILSVLGIQSTGKSTLLNTMFGLRFTVSAGRCTRGAFMQLLPLNQSLKKETNCDYLLIIDTEGLRAPELSSQETQKHDNELATFVIGLANVTLINIFGETPGDMDDILQRAVHAFIRMEHVGLTPSCQFVHQNVGAVSGASRGMMGRVNFQEKLNKMTRAAAEEEGLGGHYTLFSHVINFNEEKDVWYFPGLWKGDPPMAPVNPGYSDGAQKLKSGLIEITGFQSDGAQPLTEKTNVDAHGRISAFQSRIHDLWKAILHENFIFSFKNTLEITAYNRLDAMYAQWAWQFQQKMSEWLNKAKNKIGNATIDALGDLKATPQKDTKQGTPTERLSILKSLTSDLTKEGERIHAELKIQMKNFFENDEQSDILAQWQKRFEQRLDDVREEQEKEAELQCRVLISARQSLAKADSMKQTQRDELLSLVKKLVSRLEKGQLNEKKLEELYEETWLEWMTKLKSSKQIDPQSKPDVELSLEGSLKQKFTAHYNRLNQKLTDVSLRTRAATSMSLEVRPDIHITANRVMQLKVWKTIVPKIEQEHIDAAVTETIEFLKQAHKYLEGKRKGKGNFNSTYCHELLKIILDAIDEAQRKYKGFTFTPEYRVDIALTVSGYAKVVFEQMIEDFRQMNDPVEYLERDMKIPFFRLFKSQYYQEAQEKAAAHNLCDRLVKPIEEAMKASLAHIIANDVKSSSPDFATKRSLKAKILTDLADKQCFDEYVKYMTVRHSTEVQPKEPFDLYAVYLKDVERSVRNWVKFYTKKHCQKSQKGKTRFTQLAESELGRLVALISTAANEVTCQIVRKWLVDFHRKLMKELPKQLEPGETVDGELFQKLAELQVVGQVTKVLADPDVTKRDSFDEYVKALERSVEDWYKRYTLSQGANLRLAKEELERLITIIITAAKNDKVATSFPKAYIDEWLPKFHFKLRDHLTLNLEEMQKVVGDLKDPENFTAELCKKLAALNVEEFQSLPNMDKWDEQPHNIVVKTLIGCCDRCPFCKEQCELTIPNHTGEKHSVSLHRPQCLGGRSWVGTGKMVLETCNACVASETQFRYKEKDDTWQWKPYPKYQDVHPTWTISPDGSLEAASYWKWFVAKYTVAVAELYKKKTNEIPDAWKTLTSDQVKEDIKKLYLK